MGEKVKPCHNTIKGHRVNKQVNKQVNKIRKHKTKNISNEELELLLSEKLKPIISKRRGNAIKINFIIPDINTIIFYKNVLKTMIDPICKYLDKYDIIPITQSNAVNVHFFNEHSYLTNVKLNGINVFIPHGLGDKAWRNSKENQFDYVTASSELWKDILLKRGIKKEKIIICGYPKIDLFYDIEKKENSKKTILWCPTHNTNMNNLTGVSSNPAFRKVIDWIPDKYNFVEHVHPYNHKEHSSTCEDLINADIVITDFSSMIFEAIILGKPVIFPDWIVKGTILSYYRNTLEGKMYIENMGLHATTFDELIPHIESSIEHGLDEKTINFAEEILPTKFRGTSGKYIADFLMSL